ncbi:BTAD domain-containing putative transcriptional regulator [Amycolatopsis thailandensis]|uniref:BTAD domain-containing putative transcriptional regulator n=1 Tax=Amycolatopsis thailandensis TaxID=589330 RepID=UPI0036398F1A
MSEERLKVQVLGSLRVWLDGEEIDLGPARQRAVFATLATRAGDQPVTRSELIQAVWGSAAPPSANGSVHTYISGLRRILEPDRTRWSTDGLLLSDTAGYRLRLGPDALDATQFDQLSEAARAYWQDGDATRTVETLDNALALWSGGVLSGVPGPYAEALRGSLAEQRILAVELRASALLRLGSHEDLIPELNALVREHPLREPLWCSLMTALHRSGRTTEALDAFRNVREILRRELGVVPGRELLEVHEQILTNDPLVAKSPSEAVENGLLSVLPGHVARALEERRTAPGICWGRESEIELLRGFAEDVMAGRGRTVWIEGEPGIGKSTLLTYALADVGAAGCHVAWANASEFEARMPLHAILASLGLDPETLGMEPTPNEADPVAAQADQVAAHIDRLCATAPLVLVVDDLQWADEASVILWNWLSAATRQLPLLLIATSRQGHPREDLAQARRAAEARGLEVITLGPLATPAAEGLLGELAGARPGEELRSLITKAAGNPLYLREVTRVLLRENALEIVDGVAEVREGTKLQPPDSLFAAAKRTLDLLGNLTREAMRRAAVLGMEFGLGEVAATMGKSPSELLGVFDEVIAAQIIVDTGTHLTFRHPMLRCALYQEIPAQGRAEWHSRAAEALAESGATLEHVAQHLVVGHGKMDDWVPGWLAEHNEALSTRAPSIAAPLFSRALKALPSGDPQREVLLAAYVLVLFQLGEEPLELAKEAMLSRDPDRSARMRNLVAAMAHSRGDSSTAIAVLESDESPDAAPIWQERRRALLADIRRGDVDDIGRAAQRSYRTALGVGEPYPIGRALQNLWLIRSIERDHGTALHHVDQALATVEGLSEHTELYFDLLDNRVHTLQNLDRLDEAKSTLRTARRASVNHTLAAGLRVSDAAQDYYAGDWDDVLAELDTVTEDGPAITTHRLGEPAAYVAALHGVASLIHGRRGELREAGTHLEAAENRLAIEGSGLDVPDFLLAARCLQAEQRHELGEAIDGLRPVLTRPETESPRHQWLPWLIRLARENGDDQVVAEALRICRDEASKEVLPARAATAALWCEALGSGDPAPLWKAIAHYDKVGRRVEKASALRDVAHLLAEHGRTQEAQAAADEATQELGRLGARWDLRELARGLSGFAIDLAHDETTRPAEGSSSLSPLESEVVKLAGRGLSNPEIAGRLTLPRRTIQALVARALAKLGLSSRYELAMFAQEPSSTPGR